MTTLSVVPITTASYAVKYCRDCKWARPTRFMWFFGEGWDFAKCRRPSQGRPSIVTGKRPDNWNYCSVERMHEFDTAPNICGRVGKFFEPK
jgi:hypothetical protein